MSIAKFGFTGQEQGLYERLYEKRPLADTNNCLLTSVNRRASVDCAKLSWVNLID